MASANEPEFVEVVPPMDVDAADERFRDWLVEKGLDRVDLPDDEIRVDTIRGIDGTTVRRYRLSARFV
jgi:hypothetical protein